MSIPATLRNKALELNASIGRQYDCSGKHVAYWYQVSPDWRVYRGTVQGMLHVLKFVSKKGNINEV